MFLCVRVFLYASIICDRFGKYKLNHLRYRIDVYIYYIIYNWFGVTLRSTVNLHQIVKIMTVCHKYFCQLNTKKRIKGGMQKLRKEGGEGVGAGKRKRKTLIEVEMLFIFDLHLMGNINYMLWFCALIMLTHSIRWHTVAAVCAFWFYLCHKIT